ncbi:hypothetical protein V6N12_013083 [Hibiscus sabdariffa]|uniref:Secreted peptide n=1 Tax=Hibiscus sabdariffa TaxID=183260 RepID=A0ABR2EG93_9ROSI
MSVVAVISVPLVTLELSTVASLFLLSVGGFRTLPLLVVMALHCSWCPAWAGSIADFSWAGLPYRLTVISLLICSAGFRALFWFCQEKFGCCLHAGLCVFDVTFLL